MNVEFRTENNKTTYAPPEEAKRTEDNRKMVWVRLDSGEIKPAFMR